jgi:AraC family transcriptional regulator of adaptative response/methylated-DNA-[protein]-cysteine methyltransferase
MRSAWKRRDPGYDGLFCIAVKTTGIYCRPSCPSTPKPEHLEFFQGAADAESAGYRPCKRCRPEAAVGEPPGWVAALITRLAAAPDRKFSARDLRSMGVTPERARRWFQRQHGMTFAAWHRGLRLSRAWTQLRSGNPLDDVALGNGFESHSGFRSAFERAFGGSPGRTNGAKCLKVCLIETPLGVMLAAADDEAVCHLEFADPRTLTRAYAALRARFGTAVVPGENGVLRGLRRELIEYFEGTRREFRTPMKLAGTEFQKKVWRELHAIPHGATASYETIATRMGSPRAVRAVARANAANPIYLLVPCHRVIAKDGTLSGYGGGVWRKRLLIELESRRKERNS